MEINSTNWHVYKDRMPSVTESGKFYNKILIYARSKDLLDSIRIAEVSIPYIGAKEESLNILEEMESNAILIANAPETLRKLLAIADLLNNARRMSDCQFIKISKIEEIINS